MTGVSIGSLSPRLLHCPLSLVASRLKDHSALSRLRLCSLPGQPCLLRHLLRLSRTHYHACQEHIFTQASSLEEKECQTARSGPDTSPYFTYAHRFGESPKRMTLKRCYECTCTRRSTAFCCLSRRRFRSLPYQDGSFRFESRLSALPITSNLKGSRCCTDAAFCRSL